MRLKVLACLLMAGVFSSATAASYVVRFPAKNLKWDSPDVELRNATTNTVLSGFTFPDTKVGRTSTMTFKFVNKSPNSITFNGSPFSVGAPFGLTSTTCAGTLAAAASCDITLNFIPFGGDYYNRYVSVLSDMKKPTVPEATGRGVYSYVNYIYSGYDLAYVRLVDGTWMLAGDNRNNITGAPAGTPQYATYYAPVPDLTGIVEFVSGYNNRFVRKADNTWWAAGWNSSYELGLGDTVNRSQFTRVPALDGATQVYPGDSYSIAKMSDGVWRVIGYDGLGRLGMTGNKTVWTAVPELAAAVQVVPDDSKTFMRKADGTWWATGSNGQGQLGLGNTTNRFTYTYIPGIDGATTVSISSGTTFAKMADGSWKATGENSNGMLGLGDTVRRTSFTAVPSAAGMVKVVTNNNITLMQAADGRWYGAGSLASFFSQANSNVFVEIPQLAGAAEVTAKYGSPLLVKMSDGRLMAGGRNWYGEVGVGDYNPRTPPVLVSP